MMRFGPRLPNDTATLLLVTSFIIVIVGVAHATHEPAAPHERAISTVAAVALLRRLPGVGGAVRARRGARAQKHERPRRAWRWASRSALLAAGGVGAAFVSDWFVAALRPTIDQLGVSEAFAGLVVVAIAGNAVENVVGLVLARKGQSDLAISVVKNSVAQVAAFLYPALVLISLLFAHQLTFALAAGADRGAAAHRAGDVADHRRRRGGRVRGLGARGHLRDPGGLHALRVMGRRARIVVLAVLGAVVVLVAGGYAVLALTGDDAPPPPRLEGTPAQEGAARRAPGAGTRSRRRAASSATASTSATSGVGVRTAVGRTSAVTGQVTVTATASGAPTCAPT